MFPLILLFGCNSTPPPPQMKPPAVTVAEPVQKTVIFNQDFTGTLASIASVDIRARADGILEKVLFTPSEEVKEGQLLFEIQRNQYQATLDKAQAALEAANAQLIDATATLERNLILLKKQAVTPQDVDDARADKERAQAAVDGAKADIEQAKINLGYTSISAPISGSVSRNLVDAGNLVGSGENTLLTTIVTMDPIYVYFDVSERILLNALKNGRDPGGPNPIKVYVGLSNEEGYPHEGIVDFWDNKVDPGTGTIQLRAKLPNPEVPGPVAQDSDQTKAAGQQNKETVPGSDSEKNKDENLRRLLYPGVYVRVRVPGNPIPGAVLVHDVAIGTDLAGKYLLVVGEKNMVEKRPVEIGQMEDNMRVILKGIEPGEKYIYEGLQRARPGRPVTITNNSAASESAQQKPVKTDAKAGDTQPDPKSSSR
ncbi:efflux RND transporter periplasmic adaptor subunit [Gimesia maris]|uniref:efflux RND transporter periplasmic adaptor subunit n=1 Tax=Gimesia maris TaxID=122 RepID=UPI0012B9336C|nr:efflux RND transporter periplasmic adaptor subunit [Gimesia maris]